MVAYDFGKQVQRGFDQAVQRVTQALAGEGFGVLTEIDVAATPKTRTRCWSWCGAPRSTRWAARCAPSSSG